MKFGLMIIGDEILTGSRQDSHFIFFKNLLGSKGLSLAWTQYLPDDRALLTEQLQHSFAGSIPVFVTGGIGATPDDHTRQAAAQALAVPLMAHPEAAQYLETVSLQQGDALDSPAHLQRVKMAEFPQHAALIPNPFNHIAGFSIHQHYFFPGFPKMAHPMAEWVLNTYYAKYFFQHQQHAHAAMVDGLAESKITPLMLKIEHRWPEVKTFSLPTIREDLPPEQQVRQYRLEFGLKAPAHADKALSEAWQYALAELKQLGATRLTLLEHSSET
ncbi:molybdopterin-binding protein [Neisseriaceae bacterium ESL0693]|nr:molybdopterin-binding protein [Neisseriaceae bacterium ESL0693]